MADLMSAIQSAIDAIDACLNDLDAQVKWVAQVWEGAASDGFQRKITDWKTASADLRGQLSFLHDMVANAARNHADAVTTNLHMWQV